MESIAAVARQGAPQKLGSSSESAAKSSTETTKIERVSVRLTGELGQGIRDLQDVTHATSPSEVVRRAIVVYRALVDAKVAGHEPLIVVREDGQEKRVPIFL